MIIVWVMFMSAVSAAVGVSVGYCLGRNDSRSTRPPMPAPLDGLHLEDRLARARYAAAAENERLCSELEGANKIAPHASATAAYAAIAAIHEICCGDDDI